MAFETLSERLQSALKSVTRKGKLTEKDVDVMMREVRLALLEADVNIKVVREFIKEVKEKAIGETVLKSLTPGQQVIKIVNEELTKLMGENAAELNFGHTKPAVFMMVGLQGAGKTTHTGKLSTYLRKKEKKNPLLVACDVYRPAAVDQLKTIGKQLNIPVFEKGTSMNPVDIANEAMAYARENGHDLVIIDTAGRLHIDEQLMDELKDIKALVKPQEILLVVDAMTGQDAVNVAQSFHEQLDLTGVILTKLDGDTRGGAALSIRKITNVPIKFMGMGEKLDTLEVFHPERMASRILGMGDVMTLIERAQENFDEEESMKLADKMMNATYDFNDFLKQMKQMKKLGAFEDILKLIPGVGNQLKDINIDPKQMARVEAIIYSMTEQERKNPDLINASRKNRIAKGCGCDITEVNRLIKQFTDMRKMMKKFSNMDPRQMERMAAAMQRGGGNPMAGLGGMMGQGKKGKGKGRGGFRF
ncbi:signal recognition particle protein [Turicibacter bilis]|uniref:Signal recognition particle protein n=1 Tax=Turicibacter bilis TaxID=2735723 RepID=A0A9Q9CG36_9FIRM|nr:signal recognition particle protein [Turicibacter bilis]MBP3908570.1 signal recognition particle protein [Turicibacter sp.]MBS3197935.1 signal recognition particle protein [Turicibacter bilis]MDD5985063.1 signal recognition particle protein [Turicibacter sp.]UUF07923.1 signal recognition particle protein [Turicibacter bilis]